MEKNRSYLPLGSLPCQIQPCSETQPKKVLLVDDEKEIQDLLFFRLTRHGYQVTCAQDGVQALTAVHEHLPDIILLDLCLPKLSGEEVCKAVREDLDEHIAGIPIIMITAKDGEVDRIIGRIIGADAYVSKPFDSSNLLDIMDGFSGSEIS